MGSPKELPDPADCASTIASKWIKEGEMDSLLSNPLAPAVIVVAATLVLLFLWKVLQLALKLAATLVFVAVIGLLVFGLTDLGFIGF